MKDYYLIDTYYNKNIKKYRLYETAAMIAIRCGSMLAHRTGYNEDIVKKFWKYGRPLPSSELFRRNIKIGGIKWFIKNKVKIEDEVWNSDFINGIALSGKIIWSESRYPIFTWENNKIIKNILKRCPFGGKVENNKWKYVPAFHLQYSTESLSYMAGVMSVGQIFRTDEKNYVGYNANVKDLFENYHIPIEFSTNDFIMISPFWPALFIKKMPKKTRDWWINIPDPYNADLYSAVLWNLYIGKEFYSGAIPYLDCRKTIFYKFRGDIGLRKKLKDTVLEKNFLLLDKRIKDRILDFANEFFYNRGKDKS